MTHDDAPAEGQRGRFQVWHKGTEGYALVAFVNIANPLGAIVLTLSRKDAHWETFDEVTALLPNARSTAIGDVIVSPEHQAFEIRSARDGLALAPIDFPPSRERQQLFAEWRQDYVLAEARSLREQFRDLLSGARAPSEPIRPANDNHKDRGDGIER